MNFAKNKWTEEMVATLKIEVATQGLDYCAELFNKSRWAVAAKCREWSFYVFRPEKNYNLKIKIIDLFKSGFNILEIKSKTRARKEYIIQILRSNNLFPKLRPHRLWSQEDTEYLKQNFKNTTTTKLCKDMGFCSITIRNKIKELNLKREYIDPINMDLFLNITKPEVAYFLGYFYADGSIRNRSKYPTFAIQKEDADEIKHIIHSFGTVKEYQFKPHKSHWKQMTTFIFYSRGLSSFLYENGYFEKSTRSACQILSKIPENLHCFFFRGLLDGDGSIHKSSQWGVSFAGSISQDWTFLEKICQKLKIKYRITRKAQKGGSNSILLISCFDNLITFLNHIYKDMDINKIGISRKYNNYLKLKEDCKIAIDNRISIRKINKSGRILLCLSKDKKNLFSYYYDTYEEAFKTKREIIKLYNLREYRLRELLNYHSFDNQLQKLLEKEKEESLNPSRITS